MTAEQRERHLARRRRNYQLRREKAAAAAAQLGSPCAQLLISGGDGNGISNDYYGGTASSDYSVQSNGFAPVESVKEQEEECGNIASMYW